MPRARISITFELTRALLLVGIPHAFWMVSHVQQSVSSVRRMAKHTLKELEEVSEVLNTSLKVKIWLFLKTATHFFASLAAAPLFHTHQSHCGLHRVVAAFWLRLRFRFRTSFSSSFLLALVTIFCHFDVTC